MDELVQATDFIRFYLVGVDRQTRWQFGRPYCPVRLHTVPEGLQGASFEHDFQQLVGVDGAIYRGTVDKQTTVKLKVWVADPRSSAWARQQHSRWRESLGRGKETVRLYAVSRESGYWWIDLRLDAVAEADYFDQYPGRVGEIGETVTFISDRSYWQHFDETKIFDRETCKTARMVNLGDQPAWLRYAITGTFDSIEIGVEDDLVTLPKPANTGNGWFIDTDEVWPALMDITGQDVQEQFPKAYWNKPLPPRSIDRRTSTALTINPVNPGPDFRVEVAYTPRTEQAW